MIKNAFPLHTNARTTHGKCIHRPRKTLQAHAYGEDTESQREANKRHILIDALDSNLAKWTDSETNLKPAIPKLSYSKMEHILIKSVNSILPTYIQTNTTLEQVHYCLIYLPHS